MRWFRHFGLMVRLAFADLGHKWLMNCCLMLALLAVAAPLLLLLGLKTGVIKLFIDEIKGDPHYREIISEPGARVDGSLVRWLEQHPRVVTFVRRPAANVCSVVVAGVVPGGNSAAAAERRIGGVALDLESTEGQDPLLLENGIPRVPTDDPAEGVTEVVLTPKAVDELGVAGLAAGDTLKIEVTRSDGGGRKSVAWRLKVLGIAKERIGDMKRLYVPLSFSRDVEAYKTGREVKERQWPGGGATPVSPLCDGAFLLWLKKNGGEGTDADEGDPAFLSEVVSLTAWGMPRRVQTAELGAMVGHMIEKPGESGGSWYFMPGKGDLGVGMPDFQELREFLRQRGIEVLADGAAQPAGDKGGTAAQAAQGVRLMPWVRPRKVQLRVWPTEEGGGRDVSPQVREVELTGCSADATANRAAGFKPPLPWPMWGGWFAAADAATPAPDRHLRLPADFGAPPVGRMVLEVAGDDGAAALAVPVDVVGTTGVNGKAVASAELAGLVRWAFEGPLAYQESNGQIYRNRDLAGGFRLYVKTVEELIEMEREIGAKVRVRAETAKVASILDLARNLDIFFGYVAAVAGAGAAAALAFSLFGSVESKKVDFSVLRLVGCGRTSLVFFPVTQALVVAGCAYLLSWGLFEQVAARINQTVGPYFHVHDGQRICALAPGAGLQGLALTLAVSFLVAIFAGWRASLADPAEALRQE